MDTISKKTDAKVYTIDATGKRLGKVAALAASYLLGKNEPTFAKHLAAHVKVSITNAHKLDISERKKVQEEYTSYSGYPGGLKRETLGHLITRRGYSEALHRTISGMIPKNKLHKQRIKNLDISE